MIKDIQLPESDLWAVFHGAALYGIYSSPADAQTAIDVVPKTRGPSALYTADQVRAAVLADREGRQQWQPIETAPRDGSTILLRGKGDHRIADGYWLQAAYNGNGAWVWPYVHSEPVTWMLVPADAQRAKEE
ncbi:hypothetical protein [Orrella dioscoreae]|uniref:hypothetical protein n=1 Tax=Orrella dioscoreae TaxID=1851544 RepID=UPI000BF0FCBC|nr:hypothetical protein [Orrella dioscoreae]